MKENTLIFCTVSIKHFYILCKIFYTFDLHSSKHSSSLPQHFEPGQQTEKKKHLHVENCLLKQHFKDSKWKVSTKRSILNVWMFNQSPHGRKKKVFNVKTKSSSQLALVVKLWPQTCKRRRKAASRGTAKTVKLEMNKTDMSWVRSERLSTYGWRNFHFQVGCWN